MKISMLKNILCMPILLLILMSVSSANATIIETFTSESHFTSQLVDYDLYNFDDFQVNTLISTEVEGITFANAIVYPGCCGGTSKSGANVLLNKDFVNPIQINFDSLVFSIGLSNTSLADAEQLSIYDSNDLLLESIYLRSGVVNFGGFISNVGISRVEIKPAAPTNGTIYIDDLIVGHSGTTSVPEPPTIILFMLLLIFIFTFRKLKAK
ncbi:PEP-CTERM sorting domain-containing protein [Agarivorans sp. QJM3NY_29]|uniref:PEP-CTERM sorting domain-containing protein n=1 Tax=unclassified Agarivorans TaxID=2636026 RepID=UPI003D7CAE67